MKYISPQEAAMLADVSYNTMMNHIKSGKLKATKDGGLWRIDEKDLQIYIERMKHDE